MKSIGVTRGRSEYRVCPDYEMQPTPERCISKKKENNLLKPKQVLTCRHSAILQSMSAARSGSLNTKDSMTDWQQQCTGAPATSTSYQTQRNGTIAVQKLLQRATKSSSYEISMYKQTHLLKLENQPDSSKPRNQRMSVHQCSATWRH